MGKAKKASPVQQPLPPSFGMMCSSFLMLVIRVWYAPFLLCVIMEKTTIFIFCFRSNS